MGFSATKTSTYNYLILLMYLYISRIRKTYKKCVYEKHQWQWTLHKNMHLNGFSFKQFVQMYEWSLSVDSSWGKLFIYVQQCTEMHIQNGKKEKWNTHFVHVLRSIMYVIVFLVAAFIDVECRCFQTFRREENCLNFRMKI